METAKNVSDVSVEELNKEAQEVAESNAKRNPEEIAAGFFMQYYPSYKVLLGKLNRKDAVRLADALVAWPLEIEKPKFVNSDGHTAFRLALQLLDCKMVMRNVVEMENIQNAIDETQNSMVESTVENEANNNEGEKTNG